MSSFSIGKILSVASTIISMIATMIGGAAIIKNNEETKKEIKAEIKAELEEELESEKESEG